jgi:hypothetical protein
MATCRICARIMSTTEQADGIRRLMMTGDWTASAARAAGRCWGCAGLIAAERRSRHAKLQKPAA